MKIFLTNTLTRKKEEFIPLKSGEVSYYSCGPTVYNYAHIGNLRTYMFTDILRRVLTYAGYKVTHVMNITDVGHLTGDVDTGEDKMLLGAAREKKTVWEIADFYTQAFKEDLVDLNIAPPTIWCKATDHIGHQIALIQKLIDKGFAYEAGGNVYFDTEKFPDYGKLARLNISAHDEARVGVDSNKKNQHDFALWFTKSKFSDQEMKWESPWGVGYPGWHIECSAMSTHYLGQPFDIHSGGIDHIPVHHTNEIAQSEAGECKKMANYWLHGEFLVIDNSKMAKSDGNFITLRTLKEKGFDPLAYRYFCFQAHYRQQLNFTWEALTAAQNGYHGLLGDLKRLRHRAEHMPESELSKDMEEHISYIREGIDESLSDDLLMPDVIALIHGLVSMLNEHQTLSKNDLTTALAFVSEIDTAILGLRLAERSMGESIPQDVSEFVKEREHARSEGNWTKADELRSEIEKRGYAVEDTPTGPYVTRPS